MKLIWMRIAYVNDINHFCIGNCLFKWSGIHMYNGVILKKKFPCFLVCFFLYVLTPFYTIKTTGMWRSEILINQNEDVNKIRQNKTQTCVLNSTQFDNSKKRGFFCCRQWNSRRHHQKCSVSTQELCWGDSRGRDSAGLRGSTTSEGSGRTDAVRSPTHGSHSLQKSTHACLCPNCYGYNQY